MRGANPYVAGTAIVVLLALFAYLFSFPVAIWALVKHKPKSSPDAVIRFYVPVFMLARHCPPYRAILDYEMKLLGLPVVPKLPNSP